MTKVKNRETFQVKLLEETRPSLEALEEKLNESHTDGKLSRGDCLDYVINEKLENVIKEECSGHSLELMAMKKAFEVFFDKSSLTEKLQKTREQEMKNEKVDFESRIDEMKISLHDFREKAKEDMDVQINLNNDLRKQLNDLQDQNIALNDLVKRQNLDVSMLDRLKSDFEMIRLEQMEKHNYIAILEGKLSSNEEDIQKLNDLNTSQKEKLLALEKECKRLGKQKQDLEIRKATLDGKMEVMSSQLLDFKKKSQMPKGITN